MKLLYIIQMNMAIGYIQLQHWPDSKKREGTAAVRMRCIIVDIAYLCILLNTCGLPKEAKGIAYLWIA